MKECPECGSVLADNEPYCENCGFDPGLDSGNWNHGGYNPRAYVSKKPANNQNKPIENPIGCAVLITAAIFFIIVLFIYFS